MPEPLAIRRTTSGTKRILDFVTCPHCASSLTRIASHSAECSLCLCKFAIASEVEGIGTIRITLFEPELADARTL